MASTPTILLAAAALTWSVAAATAARPENAPQKSTNDGIYTKEQADGARPLFVKVCQSCHPFTVAAKKNPKDFPLGEAPFFDEWEGRPVKELINIIVLTMPNDGSAVLNDQEATDLVAYILQQNGFAAGKTPLTKATEAVVERPK
jgi:cytochrome c5